MHDASTTNSLKHPVLTGLTVMLVVFIGASVTAGLSPVLPRIRDAFADTPGVDFMTKALGTVGGLAAILIAPFMGWLLQRLGFRNLLLICAGTYLAAGLVGMVAPNLPILLVTRFFAGLASAASMATGFTFLMSYYPTGPREKWMGFVGTFGAAWGAASAMLGGALGEYGWRYALLMHVAAIPIALFVVLFIPNGGTAPAVQTQRTADTGSWRRFLPQIALGMITGAVVLTTAVYLPFAFVANGVSDPGRIARLFSLYSVASGVSAMAYGLARRWLSIAAINVVMFGIVAPSYFALAYLWGPLAHWIELILLGLGVGMLTPNLMAYAGRHGDVAEKGRSIGLTKGAYFGGAFLFQAALSLVAIKDAQDCLAVLAATAVVGMLFLVHEMRPEKARPTLA